MYGPGGNATTPKELDALMHAIGSDKARYEAMVAWKFMPVGAGRESDGARRKMIYTAHPWSD